MGQRPETVFVTCQASSVFLHPASHPPFPDQALYVVAAGQCSRRGTVELQSSYLKVTCHSCHILFFKTSHKDSPDVIGGKIYPSLSGWEECQRHIAEEPAWQDRKKLYAYFQCTKMYSVC